MRAIASGANWIAPFAAWNCFDHRFRATTSLEGRCGNTRVWFGHPQAASRSDQCSAVAFSVLLPEVFLGAQRREPILAGELAHAGAGGGCCPPRSDGGLHRCSRQHSTDVSWRPSPW